MTQVPTGAETQYMGNALTVISLIVSIIGGALGAFSILVTWKLYQAGSKLNIETLRLLAQIGASSHTTEVTSTRFTERLVEALTGLVGRDLRATVAQSGTAVTQRIEETLTRSLEGVDPAISDKLRKRILADLGNAFRTLEYQTAAATRLPEADASESAAHVLASGSLVAPAVPRVMRWLSDNEKRFRFFSVRFLRERVFGGDPAAQEALQFAIDRGLLELYDEPNPEKPSFPTKSCRFNRDNKITQELLRDFSKT